MSYKPQFTAIILSTWSTELIKNSAYPLLLIGTSKLGTAVLSSENNSDQDLIQILEETLKIMREKKPFLSQKIGVIKPD